MVGGAGGRGVVFLGGVAVRGSDMGEGEFGVSVELVAGEGAG